MDASQKPDVRLVEGAGQKRAQKEKSAEISFPSATEDQFRTASEPRAEGKALREDVPREAHGGWKLPTGGCCSRRSPLNRLVGSGAPLEL